MARKHYIEQQASIEEYTKRVKELQHSFEKDQSNEIKRVLLAKGINEILHHLDNDHK